MKLRTHAILFVVKYLWVPASSAYTPGSDIIRECLECKAALRQATMLSGNTIGARLWTDGKLMAPMLPDHPWLVTCPKCNALIWIDEVNKLAEQHDWDKSRDRPNAITPGIPTEMDYLELLDGLLPRTKELYLRRQAWWTANDAVRTDESAQVVWSTAQQTNLEALARLMDEKDPNQQIMKAEIYRQLGKFDDCIELLTHAFENEYHAEVAAFIKGLARQGTRTVREINDGEQPNKPPEATSHQRRSSAKNRNTGPPE